MRLTKNNTIFKKSILGFLVLVVFLAPLSVTLLSFGKTENNASHFTVEKNIIRAQAINPADPEFQLQPFGNGVTPTINLTPNIVNAPAQNSAHTVKQETKKPNTTATNDRNPSTWYGTAAEGLGNTVLSTAAMITWVGGNILEFAVDNLVFGMGGLINEKGFGGAIDLTWKVIRDICNLVFIFGFIYTGIRTIIDPESAETKRFVAQIIIAALLINFSLFFTKIIIDFTNFTAIQLYQTVIGNTFDNDISTKFANLLGLSGFYNSPDGQNLASLTNGGSLWFFIMGSIMLLVAGFVLAAGGILLVVRFVALIFIMIFSPILFAASVFPQTEEYSSKLWHQLLSYAFFAPLFLLLLLISLTVLDKSKEVLGIGQTISSALQNSSHDAFEVILNFVIVIMFLIFSLKSAQHLGVAGGEMAVHMGDHLRKNVQSAIGRNTVGAGSRYLLHKYEHANASASKKFNETKIGKFAQTKRGKIVKGALKGALNVGTFGVASVLDDRSIRHVLHAGENAKFGGHYSNEDDRKEEKQYEARNERLHKSMNILHLAEALPHDPDKYINAPLEQTKALYDAVRKASQGELIEAFKDLDPVGHEFQMIVRSLKNSQFEELKKVTHDDFGEELKVAMRTARDAHFDPLEKTFAEGTKEYKDRNKLIERELGMRKAEDVALLDKDILINASILDAARKTKTKNDDFHLRIDILEKILSPGKLDRGAQQTIYANLKRNFVNLPDEVQGYLRTSSVQRNYESTSGSSETTGPEIIIPSPSRPRPRT